MRGSFLSFWHPSPIVLVGLLMLSTHSLLAQRTLPLARIQIQLLETSAPFARVSEVQTPRHLTYRRLFLTFAQNQGQSDPWMRFFRDYPGDSRPPMATNAALSPPTRTTEQWGELWGKEKYPMGSAPSKWGTFALTYGRMPRETICCADILEHYVHRIPWAGSIILRIGQQARAHPHITRVIRVLKPRL